MAVTGILVPARTVQNVGNQAGEYWRRQRDRDREGWSEIYDRFVRAGIRAQPCAKARRLVLIKKVAPFGNNTRRNNARSTLGGILIDGKCRGGRDRGHHSLRHDAVGSP